MNHLFWSAETYRCLRNTSFQGGVYEGAAFIRCVPQRTAYPWKFATDQEQRAAASRVGAEVGEPGVVVAHHPDFGDYVRVGTDTATYRLICHLKS